MRIVSAVDRDGETLKVKKVDSHSAGLSGEEIAKMLDAEDHDIRLDLSDSAWRHIKEELK